MKKEKVLSEPLQRTRSAKLLMRLSQAAVFLLLAAGVALLYLRRYHEAWALCASGVLCGIILALPAAHHYRKTWKEQSLLAGYGIYAEQVELDENPHMASEQFELKCLFPLDEGAVRDFDTRRQVRLICRDRLVEITEMTVPARIRGLEALVDGCMIQMNMPRAPLSHLMLTGVSFGGQEALTAWYRKNLHLLPASFSIQSQMQAYTDYSEPSVRTIAQLHRITEIRPRDMILSISGRELTIFIRNAVLLAPAPMCPGKLTQEKLEQLTIPELPAILDFAFDTESLRAGSLTPFDDELDRKQAGLRMLHEDDDSAFQRPEDHE